MKFSQLISSQTIESMSLIKNRRGVSMYVATVFVAAMMLVSASLAYQMVSGKANSERWAKKDKIEHMLASAQEAAEWIITSSGIEGADEQQLAAITAQARADLEALALEQLQAIDPDAVPADLHCDDVDPITPGQQPCFELKIFGKGRPAQVIQAREADAGGANEAQVAGAAAPNGAIDYNNVTGSGKNFASGTFQFKGATVYSVPLPGTGSVAGSESTTDGFAVPCVNSADIDDPCNWNKLAFGESAEIPLYREEKDANGATVIRGLPRGGQLYLRMRTPCKDKNESVNPNADALSRANIEFPNTPIANGDAAAKLLGVNPRIPGTDFPRNCPASDRIVLYPAATPNSPDYLSVDKDPVIVQWLVKGSGGLAELLAMERLDNGLRYALDDRNVINRLLNDQLSSGRLNKSREIGDYINLNTNDKGYIISLILEQPKTILEYINLNQNFLKKPKLKLNAISPLRKDANGRQSDELVPYLEYQFLTSEQIAEFQPKYEVTVRLFGMSAKKSGKITQPTGGSDFVLGNL